MEQEARPMKVSEMVRTYYPAYYKWETYPADRCACIRKTTDEWGVLHNMAATPLSVEGVSFKCCETLFQLMKFKEEEVVTDVYRRNNKKWAQHWEKQGRRREDWGMMIVDALKFCLQTKYEQSEAFRQELARSKGLYIVEDETGRKSTSYGVRRNGNCYEGSNLLGRLLMELRDEGRLTYQLPADALHFAEILKANVTK